MLAGDDVHIFDAASKAHESTFSIRGDKGVTNDPTAVHFVGDTSSSRAPTKGRTRPSGCSRPTARRSGGHRLGGKDEKPLSTYKGSVSILDKTRIGVAEHGMETLTTYQVDNGARAKLVRKIKTKPACKPAELDAYWHDERQGHRQVQGQHREASTAT